MSSIPSLAALQRLRKPHLLSLCADANIVLPPTIQYTRTNLIDMLTEARRQANLVYENERRQRAQEHANQYRRQLDIHRQQRSRGLRRQANVDPECLAYPLSFLDEYGGPANIYNDLPGQEVLDVSGFPNNVTEYFWIHEGENDGEPWKAVGHLKSGVYVFFKGECDYTGFDCQGNMFLYAARDIETLVDLAMDINDYDQWIAETSPAE